MDVDARHALVLEHGPVGRVVLEGQPEIEAVLSKRLDRAALEDGHPGVVAPVPHDEQVEADREATKPGLGLASTRSGRPVSSTT